MGEFIDLLKSLMTDTDEDEINDLVEDNIEWSEGKALIYSSNQHSKEDIIKVLQESFKRGVITALEFAGDEAEPNKVIDVDSDDDDDDDDDDDNNDEDDDDSDAMLESEQAAREEDD